MRDAKLQVVMHPNDIKTYVNRGVPRGKLFLLPHPILRQAGRCFKTQRKVTDSAAARRQALFLLPENTISFREGSLELISPAEVHRMRCDVLSIAADALPDWRIIIKPHPLVKDTDSLEGFCREHCPQAVFVSKDIQVEDLISKVAAVVEFPRSGSTALYTALLWAPGIPKIAINCGNEFYADYYRDFPGIIYVSSLRESREGLLQLHAGTLEPPEIPAFGNQGGGGICPLIADGMLQK